MNTRNTITILLIMTGLVSGTFVFGAYADDGTLVGTIQIGGLYPLTGEGASFGTEVQLGTELGVEEFNAYLAEQGADWRFELVSEDTETKPTVALEKTTALYARGIDIIVGMIASSSVTQAKIYADSNNMLIMSPGSTSPALSIPNDSVYRLIPDDINQGKAVGKILDANGITAMVPLWRGDTYGDGLKNAASENFESRGGVVHPGVRYTPDLVDFSLEVELLSTYVQETADIHGIENTAIFIISFDEVVNLLQVASNYPILQEVKWVASEAIAGSSTILDDPITSQFVADTDILGVMVLTSPGGKYEHVQSVLHERLGYAPNQFTYPAYDVVWVLGLSMMEAGSTDIDAIKEALPGVAANYADGAMASAELNDNGDLAVANYEVLTIQDNEWTTLQKYAFSKDILASPDQPEGDVKVATLYPLTGRLAHNGVQVRDASVLGVEDFNAFLQSLDMNWRLELVNEDSATSPTVALEKAQALNSRGINIVMGPELSSNAKQIKPYADVNGMIFVSCCSTSPSVAIPDDSIFRLVPDDSNQGKAMAKFLRDEGIDAIVPIWRNDAYGNGLHDATAESFAARGGFVYTGIQYNPEVTDFAGEVSTLASEVDAAINDFGAEHVAVFIISFDEVEQIMQGADNYDILDDLRWFGAETLTKKTPLVEDRIISELIADVNFASLQIQEDQESRGDSYYRVQSHMKETLGGNDPITFVYQAYDSAWLIGLSILESGSADSLELRQTLPVVAATYEGTLGSTALNHNGDLASADYVVWRIIDGEWINTNTLYRYDEYSMVSDEIVQVDEDVSATTMLSDGTTVMITSSEPTAGESMSIDLTFQDSEHVNYDISIVQGDVTVLDDSGVHAHDGTNTHTTEPVPAGEPVDIIVTFQGYGVDEITGPTNEELMFAQIVPEFGVTAALILAIAIVSIVVVTTRSRLGIMPRY